MNSAFVTGATGLLGNNLVRELVARGYAVKALVRSRAKGEQQFNNLPGVELVVGDMADVDAFSASLQGCDTMFHTAAFFRDNYKGGSHWKELEKINVSGTRYLLNQAYRAGIRRFIHTSSIAVLDGAPGMSIDETCLRADADADTTTEARSSPTVSSCRSWSSIPRCMPAWSCLAGCGALPTLARPPRDSWLTMSCTANYPD